MTGSGWLTSEPPSVTAGLKPMVLRPGPVPTPVPLVPKPNP